MPSNAPRPRPYAVAAAVTAGLLMVGMSASGVAAINTDLRAAEREQAPTRLVQDLAPHTPGAEWLCSPERDGPSPPAHPAT